MKEVIENLEAEKAELKERIGNIEEAIKAIRKICKHENEDYGHDSHHSYVKCKICGLVEQS